MTTICVSQVTRLLTPVHPIPSAQPRLLITTLDAYDMVANLKSWCNKPHTSNDIKICVRKSRLARQLNEYLNLALSPTPWLTNKQLKGGKLNTDRGSAQVGTDLFVFRSSKCHGKSF